MNSWESPRRNLTKDQSSSSGLCWWQLQEHLQLTKRFAPNSKIAKISLEGDGGSRGSCERSCGNTIPSHLSCPATIGSKRGTRTLAIYFQNKKFPPPRNRPILPKPIAPNKVRAFGGQSAPPSLKLRSRPCHQIASRLSGAVRPPFIEAATVGAIGRIRSAFGGQSAPPSLKRLSGW